MSGFNKPLFSGFSLLYLSTVFAALLSISLFFLLNSSSVILFANLLSTAVTLSFTKEFNVLLKPDIFAFILRSIIAKFLPLAFTYLSPNGNKWWTWDVLVPLNLFPPCVIISASILFVLLTVFSAGLNLTYSKSIAFL